MKKLISRISYILIVLYFASGNLLFSQKVTSIQFISDSDTTLKLNSPIDEAYNFYVLTDKLDLKAGVKVDYELLINDFGVVRCEYSPTKRDYFMLQEGDSIEVHIKNDSIKLIGKIADGLREYIKIFTAECTEKFYLGISDIFKRNVSNSVDFEGISRDAKKLIDTLFIADIERLKVKGKLTPSYASLLTQSLTNKFTYYLYLEYRNLLRGRVNNYKASASDSLRVEMIVTQMYDNPQMMNEKSLRFPENGLNAFFKFKYLMMNKEKKEKFNNTYDYNIWGGAISNFLAPNNFKPLLLGQALMFDMQYSLNDIDIEKAVPFFTSNYPQYEYTDSVQSTYNKINAKHINSNIIIHENTMSINSLKSLTNMEELKGKYIYIDLWATWCAPCKGEFKYAKETEELLSSYKNMAIVYISIDDSVRFDLWKKQIYFYNLVGNHLVASKELKDDIQSKIYLGKSLGIPRYIVLDPQGNIIDNNLPRPSMKKELIAKLNDIIK